MVIAGELLLVAGFLSLFFEPFFPLLNSESQVLTEELLIFVLHHLLGCHRARLGNIPLTADDFRGRRRFEHLAALGRVPPPQVNPRGPRGAVRVEGAPQHLKKITALGGHEAGDVLDEQLSQREEGDRGGLLEVRDTMFLLQDRQCVQLLRRRARLRMTPPCLLQNAALLVYVFDAPPPVSCVRLLARRPRLMRRPQKGAADRTLSWLRRSGTRMEARAHPSVAG
ncbi:hypothetical protein [Streptomyces kanamyceticus]|uniref:hypothetical protein n=1 Tax=Streptomyces kanamyceticus TaxID=1967 RepID=UPI0037DCF0A8